MARLTLLIMLVMVPALVLSIDPYIKFLRQNYGNNYYGKFISLCNENENMAYMFSTYNRWKADRRAKIGCKPSDGPMSNCNWARGVLGLEDRVKTECPGNGIFAGVHSNYTEETKRRGIFFRCCYPPASTTLTDCKWTVFLNELQGFLRFITPKTRVWTGFQAKYTDSKTDFEAQFKLCSMTRA